MSPWGTKGVTHMTRTEQACEFFAAHPHDWHSAITLEQFGRHAWRTRVSEARALLPGRIENRQRHSPTGHVISEYRYVPEVTRSPLLELLENV